MSEDYEIVEIGGEPLPAGAVGMRVCVRLSGCPSSRWSRALTARLGNELVGHAAVGHLRLNEIVRGDRIVLEGVEAKRGLRRSPPRCGRRSRRPTSRLEAMGIRPPTCRSRKLTRSLRRSLRNAPDRAAGSLLKGSINAEARSGERASVIAGAGFEPATFGL